MKYMGKSNSTSRISVFFIFCGSLADRVASSPKKHLKTTYNRADDEKREPVLIYIVMQRDIFTIFTHMYLIY